MNCWGLGLLFALVPLTAVAAGWSDGAPMERARSQVRAAEAGGEIYVAGGAGLRGPIDTFEVFDPVANHWHALPALPDGREAFGMAAIGSTIYIAGGYSSWNGGSASADVAAFDVGSGQWRRLGPLPAPRIGHVLLASGTRLFIAGGRGEDAERVLVYDQAKDNWSAFGEAMPLPRTGHAGAILGNKLYVIGGRSLEGDALTRVEILDLTAGTWSRGPSLPLSSVGLTADVVDGRLHVAGGVSPAAKRTLSEHYALEVAGTAWTKQKPLPTPRHGLASAVHGGKWYVIGGGAGSGAYAVFTQTDVVEVFAP